MSKKIEEVDPHWEDEVVEVDPKWEDDDFLNEIRKTTDEFANTCVSKLNGKDKDKDPSSVSRRIFAEMNFNGEPIPEETPDALRKFFEETRDLPKDVNRDRMKYGGDAFMTNTVSSAMVLLLGSIPQGYPAPALTQVLNISGALRKRPFHRLVGTLQFLVDVSSPHAFDKAPEDLNRATRSYRGIVTAQKIRLLHAGVRVNSKGWDESPPVVPPKGLLRLLWPLGKPGNPQPWDYETYEKECDGEPINMEDMLGTMIAFSLIVVRGLRTLGVPMGDPDGKHPIEKDKYTPKEEAFYYVWQVFGRIFGIHPVDEPESTRYIPQNLTEANLFFEAYRRRNFRDAEKNPAGVALAKAHVDMIGSLLAPILPKKSSDGRGGRGRRFLNWLIPDPTAIPRDYMRKIIGREDCARIGVKMTGISMLLSFLLTALPILWTKLTEGIGTKKDVLLSEFFLQALIRSQYTQDVPFRIPYTREDLAKLTQTEEGDGEKAVPRKKPAEEPPAQWLTGLLEDSRKERKERAAAARA